MYSKGVFLSSSGMRELFSCWGVIHSKQTPSRQDLLNQIKVLAKIPCASKCLVSLHTSPVLKSSKLEFDNYQSIFVWHFASQSILTTGVLAKYRSFLWNWTPSHIQRIYKGQNSENPLRAITFDWCVLQTWDQRLWAAFLMLFSGIPHLPTFCHVACVTYVTSHVSRASRMSRVA